MHSVWGRQGEGGRELGRMNDLTVNHLMTIRSFMTKTFIKHLLARNTMENKEGGRLGRTLKEIPDGVPTERRSSMYTSQEG